MNIGEKILFFLSRNPKSSDYSDRYVKGKNIDGALSLLCSIFPNFLDEIVGKTILDFGCGEGWQSVALAKKGAEYVLGIDTNRNSILKAHNLAKELDTRRNIAFMEKLEDSFKGRFDIVISQNSMEHFKNPFTTICEMKSALKENGKILITFGPPWFSPYGSHMHFFTKMPWVNIMFSEKTVMKVRANYRSDGARAYEEVESGLNKMSISKFEKIISNCYLEIKLKKYDCIRNINVLGRLPVVRELFINRASCELVKMN